jgi:uncharacterized 2Fe-2S/4Fe-4S cluster protein (DUF4445 family)
LGNCRECLVEVLLGEELLSPPAPEEENMAKGYRLSCRTRFLKNSGTVVCRTLRRSPIRIDEEGTPAEEIFGESIPTAILRREGRVYLHGRPWKASSKKLYGLALDLGTTTVVIRLMDLVTGQIKASQSFENPQRFAGSDVMSRIHFDEQDKTRTLQKVLIGYINNSIQSFPVRYRDIIEVTVAGNPTMRDLFLGLDVRGLGQLPFRSSTEKDWLEGIQPTTAVEFTARDLGIRTHPDALIYGLPLVGCHVGADTAACILATHFLSGDQPALLIDIGTNTEIVYRSSDRVLAASCPAGPAFEGGLVKCGMPALEGAIENTKILEDGSVDFETIGSVPPQGLCGSGLVSILGELTRTGRINERGRFVDGSSRFSISKNGNIFIDEMDISNLAQAKGANSAGLRILFKKIGTDSLTPPIIYLAGAFARHLDLNAARRIGLLPPLPDETFVRLGNASIEGAALALRSLELRRKLEEFVTRIEHIELETDPQFFDAFVEGCLFQPF